MNRTWKRILTFALIAAMTYAFLVSAFALDANTYDGRRYERYVYIGDSISWGYGLDPTVDPLAAANNFARIKDSYTDIVGRVLEKSCGTLMLPAESSGGRLCDYRGLLERGMGTEEPYTPPKDDWFGNRAPERAQALLNSGAEVCEKLKGADLVTVQLGINDVANAIIVALTASGWLDLSKLTNINGIDGISSYVTSSLAEAGSPIRIPAKVGGALDEQLALMQENAHKVLDDIVELSADDADILLIGYHDPFSRLRLIPGTAYSLVTDMVGLTMQSFNDYLSNLALEYDNVFFVPILGASSFYSEGDSIFKILKDNDGLMMAIHPDAAGHEFIAGRVMEKLNEINVCRHEHTKTVPPKYLGLCVCRYSGALVCADCGKTLDAGSVITPCARIPIPEISINYLAQTVENTIAAKISRVRSRILSSCAVLTSVLC